MKRPSAVRWSLSLALTPLILGAPALGTVTAVAKSFGGATVLPRITGLAPGMHGEGRGTWRGPEEGLGRLRATSRVSPDGPLFAFDAALARVVPMGPHGPEIEGTFFGQMLAIDSVHGPEVVATVVGQWMQEVDGRGWFVGHIFLLTGDANEPVLSVGRFFGPFRTPAPDSGLRQDGVATVRWDVTE